MTQTATATVLPHERVYDLVDVMDEDDQDWLPLGEPEDGVMNSNTTMTLEIPVEDAARIHTAKGENS